MANYTISHVKPYIKQMLLKAGATNVEDVNLSGFSRTINNRCYFADINGNRILIICFPIVLRTKAQGKEINAQRYIDINSSAWKSIKSFYIEMCRNYKFLLLAARHIDDEIGDYFFSIEGNLVNFNGRSVYIHENHLRDIRNNLKYKRYSIANEPNGELVIFRQDYFNKYLLDTFKKNSKKNTDYIENLPKIKIVEKDTPITTCGNHKIDLCGNSVQHKAYGPGIVTQFDGEYIKIRFSNGDVKKFNYKLCKEKKIIHFL